MVRVAWFVNSPPTSSTFPRFESPCIEAFHDLHVTDQAHSFDSSIVKFAHCRRVSTFRPAPLALDLPAHKDS